MGAAWTMTRREFLGLGALGALGATAWTRQALGTGRVPLAVLGMGRRGGAWLGRIHEVPPAWLVALADPSDRALDRGLRRAAAGGMMPRTVIDDSEILEDPGIHAVIVAVPAPGTAALARRALEAGKDVYVETPCAVTAEAIGGLGLAVERERRLVQHGLLLASNPGLRSTVVALRQGRIGRLAAARVFCTYRAAPHDVIVPETLVHELDLALRGLGVARPTELYATEAGAGVPASGGGARQTALWCRFEEGPGLELYLTALSGREEKEGAPLLQTRIEWIGSRGRHSVESSGSLRGLDRFAPADPALHLANFLGAVRRGEPDALNAPHHTAALAHLVWLNAREAAAAYAG
jgi:predicted dehydrogenase